MENQVSFLAVFCAFIFTPILVSLLLVKVNNEKLTLLKFMVILIIAMGVVIFSIVKIVNLISSHFGEITVVLILLIILIVVMGYNEKVVEFLKKRFIERDFTAKLDMKSLATTLLAIIGIPTLFYLWMNKFFIIDMNKMDRIFSTELAKVTQPLGKPDNIQTNYKFYSAEYLQYDYNNPSPQALELLTKNIKAQKQWQAVAKENMQYPESNIAEYCNKEITLMISKYEGGLSVETRWERNSYCHRNYGSPWFVPTTD